MKQILLLALLVIGAIGVSKSAVATTWNEWKDNSDSIKTVYFLGVYDGCDAMSGWEKSKYTCIPESVKNNQLRAVVEQYVRSDPKLWHYNLGALAIVAWKKAWPCK